jgi:uncharacterized membrane protein
MDLDVRYSGPSADRLKKMKILLTFAMMNKSTAVCILYLVLVLAFLGVLAGLLYKYDGKIITFPRLKNPN